MAKPNALEIDFCGEIYALEPGATFSFGRGEDVDLVIDDNPHLHRRFGLISHRDGVWWLKNEGSRLPLMIHDLHSMSSVTLASGKEVSLTFARSAIRFSAAATLYELVCSLDLPSGKKTYTEGPLAATATVDPNQIPVAGEQRLLLVALAEHALRDPHGAVSLPTNREVAQRFGWSITTFNRKLDRLCDKFSRAGVPGLVGDLGQLAKDRRRNLVTHVVRNGIITIDDLELLEAQPE